MSYDWEESVSIDITESIDADPTELASAIRKSTRQLGLELRIGIHTGECELRDESLEGVATHLAARISAIADAGEIIVSRTIKDLVVGSGLRFEDYGT